MTVTAALANLLGGTTLVAVTVTAGVGTEAGAVYKPEVLTVPSVLLPPTTPLTLQVTEVLEAPVTVTVNCCVLLTVTEVLLGEIEMETSSTTESCVEPVTPFWVAWIVVVPSCTLVTKPVALTVATPGLVELQTAVAVMSGVLPSLYVPVAVSCSLEPKTTLGLEGVMAIEMRAITVNEG